jgi:hypothetical protein
MMLLTFPKKAKQRKPARPPVNGPIARVHVFPTSRHIRMVDNIAADMRARAGLVSGDPLDAAEAALIQHLEIEWDRLEHFGVAEPERERDIRAFAVAAWALYGQQVDQSGAA